VPAPCDGWVGAVATRDVGLLVIELGGGRRQAADHIDHRVGFSEVLGIGTPVDAGDALAVVHAADAAAAQHAAQRLRALVTVAPTRPDAGTPLITR
jgi:thymidine phosphorylase